MTLHGLCDVTRSGRLPCNSEAHVKGSYCDATFAYPAAVETDRFPHQGPCVYEAAPLKGGREEAAGLAKVGQDPWDRLSAHPLQFSALPGLSHHLPVRLRLPMPRCQCLTGNHQRQHVHNGGTTRHWLLGTCLGIRHHLL